MSDVSDGESAPRPKKKKSAGSWLQQQPMAVKIGIAAGVAVPILVLAVWGFSGGDDKPTVRTNPPKRNPTPAPADPDSDQSAADETPDGPGATAPDDDAPVAPVDENAGKKERPEDPADWTKPEYFYSARKEGDPRLIEAVAHLAKRFAGTKNADKAAGLLAGVLAPPKKEEEPVNSNARPKLRHSARNAPKLIEAIVTALDTLDSAKAREILHDILAGRTPTDDDKAAVKVTLEVLAANPCLKNEGILFRAITTAKQMRGSGDATTGHVTATELREQAFKAVEPVASGVFRLELAKYLAKPDTSQEQRESFSPLIHQQHPDNVKAQLYLYQREETSGETKATLEEHFTLYSSQALAAVLGVKAEEVDASRRPSYSRSRSKRTTSKPPETPDPDLPYRIARQLWAASSVAAVQKRLGEVDSLEKGDARILALAATMPIESIRPLVLGAFRKQFNDGPKELISVGLWKSLVSDPALLPPLKMLVRKQTASRAGSKETRGKFVKIKEEWEKFTRESIRSWCDRFHAAALAGDEATRVTDQTPGQPAPQTPLPIKLPTDTKPVAEFHASFPGKAQEKLSGVTPGPVEIHYVRIEETAQLKGRLGYYRRAIGAREPEQIDDTTWLDSYRPTAQTDGMLSVDLLITQVNPPKDKDKDASKKRAAKGPEELIIEILAIRIKS